MRSSRQSVHILHSLLSRVCLLLSLRVEVRSRFRFASHSSLLFKDFLVLPLEFVDFVCVVLLTAEKPLEALKAVLQLLLLLQNKKLANVGVDLCHTHTPNVEP